MKKIRQTVYQCEICKKIYRTEKDAKECESRPVSRDRGVKVGDTVLITGGDGSGKVANVIEVSVFSRGWGHYAWGRYWHTVGLTADVVGGYASRVLTFDQYETT